MVNGASFYKNGRKIHIFFHFQSFRNWILYIISDNPAFSAKLRNPLFRIRNLVFVSNRRNDRMKPKSNRTDRKIEKSMNVVQKRGKNKKKRTKRKIKTILTIFSRWLQIVSMLCGIFWFAIIIIHQNNQITTNTIQLAIIRAKDLDFFSSVFFAYICDGLIIWDYDSVGLTEKVVYFTIMIGLY